jgi:hypothetical protein
MSVPAASSVDADAAGRATFINVRVDPMPRPDRRSFEATGAISDRTVSRPVDA